MGAASLADELRDVAFTTTTPFSTDGDSVQYDALEANLTFLLERGARLFMPCGNTGEHHSLSPKEQVGVVEATVDAVGSDGTVVGGLGGSLPVALDLARRYEAVGADGLLVMPPVHTYVHRRGLVDYYRVLAEATDLGIVLYVRGSEVSNDVLESVVDHRRVVGVKFAVNDIEAFGAAVSGGPDNLIWINGLAERFAPAFALEGAAGFTTGIGNFAPEASLTLHETLRAADWERARSIRDEIRPYEALRESAGVNNRLPAANNVPAVKFGMELEGLYGGPVRPPLVDLAGADRDHARAHYDAISSVRADA